MPASWEAGEGDEGEVAPHGDVEDHADGDETDRSSHSDKVSVVAELDPCQHLQNCCQE